MALAIRRVLPGELLGFGPLEGLALRASLFLATFLAWAWAWETGLSDPTEDVGVLGLAGGGSIPPSAGRAGVSTSLVAGLPDLVVTMTLCMPVKRSESGSLFAFLFVPFILAFISELSIFLFEFEPAFESESELISMGLNLNFDFDFRVESNFGRFGGRNCELRYICDPCDPLGSESVLAVLLGLKYSYLGRNGGVNWSPLWTGVGAGGGISLVYFDLTGRGGDFLRGPGVF